MSKNTLHNVIAEGATILDAIKAIDVSCTQIALVQRDGVLIGTVTDGDIRRAIMGGLPLSSPVAEVMNQAPATALVGTSNEAMLRMMRDLSIHQLPLVDDKGRIIGLKLLEDLTFVPREENWVLLMAGGLGTRLRPLTEDCPKPLLKVGNRPIMETILKGFLAQGFKRFFISVNYKAEMIEAYFGDGSAWGAEITYLRETEQLGTAGALSLLPERPSRPFFVMNGDLLTKCNFQHLMLFHDTHNAPATMCAREYHLTVPYGVVQTDGHLLERIEEKPVHKFFVNAGIYVLNPEAIDLLTPGQRLDMPHLFQRLMDGGQQPSVFPLREYWLDIGQLTDFERAGHEYHAIFSDFDV